MLSPPETKMAITRLRERKDAKPGNIRHMTRMMYTTYRDTMKIIAFVLITTA
jgi:hypothetical protein